MVNEMTQGNTRDAQVALVDHQRGSSTVEFFVTLIVFIPLFVGIPLLGKYADIKHKTIEASRYVAFERTVYSEPGVSTRYDSWTDSSGQLHEEATKASAQIMAEAEMRLFGHPSQGLHDTELRENPLWFNRKGESLLATVETTNENPNDNSPAANSNLVLNGTMGQTPVTDHIDSLAIVPAKYTQTVATGGGEFAGIFGGGQGAQDISDAASSGSEDIGGLLDGGGAFSDDGCGFPGINLNNGIGLGRNNYAEVSVNTPVVNFLSMNEDSEQLSFGARAAVLSNAWTVPSEAKFKRRLDNQVPNQFLGCITLPGRYTFALLSAPGSTKFLFGEGKKAYPVRIDDTPSMRLPNELKYYDEDR